MTTCARSPAEAALGTFGCGVGVGVAMAIARGGVAFSDAVPRSSTRGDGVFRGFGVSSSFAADFCSAVLFALPDVSFALGFFFAVFGFGVGVCRCFVLGVGNFFGFGVDVTPVSVPSDWSRGFSSLTCAGTRPTTMAPNASTVPSQMRKRTTATERNRACAAINAYSSDLLKKLNSWTDDPFKLVIL